MIFFVNCGEVLPQLTKKIIFISIYNNINFYFYYNFYFYSTSCTINSDEIAFSTTYLKVNCVEKIKKKPEMIFTKISFIFAIILALYLNLSEAGQQATKEAAKAAGVSFKIKITIYIFKVITLILYGKLESH